MSLAVIAMANFPILFPVNMKKVFIHILLVGFVVSIRAQDTTYLLPTANIVDSLSQSFQSYNQSFLGDPETRSIHTIGTIK